MTTSLRIGRREVFRRSLAVVPFAAGSAALLSACGGEPLVCTDVSGLTDAQRQVRTTNEYVESSPHGNTKDCTNCRFNRPVENACGTCQLVPGPINPLGYCKAWVQRT